MKIVVNDIDKTEKTMAELKSEIYELISEFFGNEDINHPSNIMAREFSEDNLDDCLSYFFESSIK